MYFLVLKTYNRFEQLRKPALSYRFPDQLHPPHRCEESGGDLHHRGAELHRQAPAWMENVMGRAVGFIHNMHGEAEKYRYACESI